jgi:NADPH:quinone reductase-like Zn-dependent oxidoreductase
MSGNTPQNRACLIAQPKAHPFEITTYPYHSPQANEITIRTRAAAINPADVGIQSHGVLVKDYPAVVGCDVAGEVIEVGAGVKGWEVGDRVFGAATPLDTRTDDKVPQIARIPEGMEYEDACVLPLGLITAASCLFVDGLLGLGLPRVEPSAEKPGKGKTLIVWAASSSVGCCGVQLASQAGYTVVGVASKRNHAMVKEAGSAVCFDQGDGDVVEQIVEYLREAKAEVVGAYDGISKEETIVPLCDILHRHKEAGFECRKFIAGVFFDAEKYAKHGVEVKLNFAYTLETQKELVGKVWEWIGVALADGRLKCLPPKKIVGEGRGLEWCQAGMDELAGGKVSGRKVVVRL